MTSTKKITKKNYYTTILDILTSAENSGYELPEEMDYDGLNNFVNHEIELLDNKAAAAAKRAADKRVAGDALRDRIYSILSDTDYMTINEIVTVLADPDVSPQMVTSRLTQLGNLEQIDKDTVTVPATTEGGKSRKVSAYKRKI